VNPVIDAINDTTFWYTFVEKDVKGLLNWNMEFEWHDVSPSVNLIIFECFYEGCLARTSS